MCACAHAEGHRGCARLDGDFFGAEGVACGARVGRVLHVEQGWRAVPDMPALLPAAPGLQCMVRRLRLACCEACGPACTPCTEARTYAPGHHHSISRRPPLRTQVLQNSHALCFLMPKRKRSAARLLLCFAGQLRSCALPFHRTLVPQCAPAFFALVFAAHPSPLRTRTYLQDRP